MLSNENTPIRTENPTICTAEKRKLYTKPRLDEIGDLRTQTLGSSPGPMESGGAGVLDYSLDSGLWQLPPE